jgi:acyl-CoA thioesterase-1
MYAPPNLGADYGRAFSDIYKRLAEKHDVPLYPVFLDGVARDPALNQADGIHPNAKGVEIMVERLMPHVVSLLNGAAG